VNKCLLERPDKRPDAISFLEHPWLQKQRGAEALKELVQFSKKWRAKKLMKTPDQSMSSQNTNKSISPYNTSASMSSWSANSEMSTSLRSLIKQELAQLKNEIMEQLSKECKIEFDALKSQNAILVEANTKLEDRVKQLEERIELGESSKEIQPNEELSPEEVQDTSLTEPLTQTEDT